MPLTGFQRASIYKVRQPTAGNIARQKISFMVASLSLLAFVMGNMVGQHGWYAFFRTVLGKEDDALIAFVGTVPPIAKIPDYTEWAKYGGDKRVHTYSQVPQSVLRDLPAYDQSALTNGTASDLAKQAYTTLWAGGYDSPNGSHAGVDIDAPRGTPVVTVGNGVVEKVSMGSVGFGHYVMVRHPNVPDGKGGTQTLYSTYAHLDLVNVTEGQVVHKGQQVGTVGNTGFAIGATGYHLYFQINGTDAPFSPYWPFSTDEIASAGLSFIQAVNSTVYRSRVVAYTLNPLPFVQQYGSYVTPTIATTNGAVKSVVSQTAASALSPRAQLRLSVAERRNARIAARAKSVSSASSVAPESVTVASSASSEASTVDPVVTSVVQTAAATGDTDVAPAQEGGIVDHIVIRHTGVLTGTWQKIFIDALDRDGNRVQSPSFSGRLYVISEFGSAVIRPTELSPLDFVNGTATVNILGRGGKTLILATRGAFNTTSSPLVPGR